MSIPAKTVSFFLVCDLENTADIETDQTKEPPAVFRS